MSSSGYCHTSAKVTADEKAASSKAAIGQHLVEVLARYAAIARETEHQRAARECVAPVEASPIIEAIKPMVESSQASEPVAEKPPTTVLERLSRLPNLQSRTLIVAGFPNPEATLLREAKNLGSWTKDPRYARDFVSKHLKKLSAESLAVADLTVKLPKPDVALSSGESPVPVEEFKTPTSQRLRAEGSGVKQRKGRTSPIDLLECIHGEILAGNHPIAAETLRLRTNAVRTLVRRKELTADEGRMIFSELSATAAI